jgi:uncharacterized protein involved in oxidation of intracellular sulfur
MKGLVILNDAPCASERAYNGARLWGAVARTETSEVPTFLIGDARATANRQQKVPAAFRDLETMLGSVIRHRGVIGVARIVAADLEGVVPAHAAA